MTELICTSVVQYCVYFKALKLRETFFVSFSIYMDMNLFAFVDIPDMNNRHSIFTKETWGFYCIYFQPKQQDYQIVWEIVYESVF
jgi:hypothetical protein